MMWYPPMEPIEFVTVKQMYAFTKESSIKLLSSYDADFWEEYIENYANYDRLFNRMFNNSYYFMQEPKATVAEVQEDFTNAVYDLLMVNNKKYSELYRIHVVDDDTYSIIDNYDVTETREGSGNRRIIDSYGQRIIEEENTIGDQENTSTGQVAPFDSEDFANESHATQNLGEREDSSTVTHDAHTDNHTYIDSDGYTLNKKGNIGVQTQSEVMDKHAKFWKAYNFYKIVFEDIDKELLLFNHAYL